MTFIRSLLYAIWFYGSLVVVGLGFLPFAWFSRKAAFAAINTWAGSQRMALRVFCGIRTEIRGLEHMPAGAAIVAVKHQSTYDTIAPFYFVKNPAFILKQELLKAPIFGIYCTRAHMIPIDRGGGLKTMKLMLQRSKQETSTGRKIIIFPEGTRQDVDAPTDLKSGVVGIYRELGVPCVPVALNTGLVWKGSGFTRRPGLAVFEILPPIEPGLSRDVFMKRLHDALEPATVRLVAEERSRKGVAKPAIPQTT